MCFANIFSQSMVYPCIFLTESFEEQKYLIWMKSNLSISFLSCPRNCVCVCVCSLRNSFLTQDHQKERSGKRFEHFIKDIYMDDR